MPVKREPSNNSSPSIIGFSLVTTSLSEDAIAAIADSAAAADMKPTGSLGLPSRVTQIRPSASPGSGAFRVMSVTSGSKSRSPTRGPKSLVTYSMRRVLVSWAYISFLYRRSLLF